MSHNAADCNVSFKIAVLDVNPSDSTIVIVEKSHTTVQTFDCMTSSIEYALVVVYRSPRKEVTAVAVQFSFVGQDVAVDGDIIKYFCIKRIAFIRRISIVYLVSKPVELADIINIEAVLLIVVFCRHIYIV